MGDSLLGDWPRRMGGFPKKRKSRRHQRSQDGNLNARGDILSNGRGDAGLGFPSVTL